MPTPHNFHEQRKERRDLIANIAACTVIAILIGLDLLNPYFDGYFNTRLSAALPEGLRISELSGAALWTLHIAKIGQGLTLLVLLFAIGRSALAMLRGEIFTKRNARLVTLASWMTLAWGILRFAVEGLGNNFAAHQLGIDYWWDLPSRGSTELTFWLTILVLISSFAITIKRGIALEEEVEGLV